MYKLVRGDNLVNYTIIQQDNGTLAFVENRFGNTVIVDGAKTWGIVASKLYKVVKSPREIAHYYIHNYRKPGRPSKDK